MLYHFGKIQMKKILLYFLFSGLFFITKAQNSFSCFIRDSKTNKPLPNVSAVISDKSNGAMSDSSGEVRIKNLDAGKIKIVFTAIGYNRIEKIFQIPQSDTVPIILMEPAPVIETEEVIISSSRTNSRIEDLPTKVEVLGSEEVDEEASTIPGNIASLLGDIAGIQNQKTSASTSNIDLRVQGLPGKYTQILRDGLPLYSGYSGGFSVLQIPPLDLKQVEIIKGASSTLYGGGAIAGMINLVSKTPKLNEKQHSLLLNYSSLKELNINTFHSRRNKTAGYTFFAGTTQQTAVDVNNDGFSDVPDIESYFFHPKLFLYPTEKNTVTLEYNSTYENRNGGDMQVLHTTKDANHQFFIRNKSFRNTIAASWENKLNKTDRLNFKGLYNFFNRDITTNVFGMKALQQTFFTEFSYLKKSNKHTLVTGANISGDNFDKKLPDSSGIVAYNYHIVGLFIQHDWKATDKLTTQTGLRFDYHDAYKPVLLPRISLLYKFNTAFSSRLGGGLGYKAPSVFNNDVDERDLRNTTLAPSILLEKSWGINWDINYKQQIDEWNIAVNQMFYITQINRPAIITTSGINKIYVNASKPFNTKGFETYVQVKHDELEMYLGYTYTIAKQLFNVTQPFEPLSAKSKFAAVISNEFSSKFRGCIEASYTGRQYLDNGSKTPGYLIAAGMLRYDFTKNITAVINCENLFDYRQTKKENIVLSPFTNPSFKQIWAPVDGRVVNFSVRFNW